ncbi:MAG: 4Fe-4S binding protein [archaeon]
MPTVTINESKCTRCGTCIEVCPMDVFEKKDDKVLAAKQDKCIACRSCEVQCPKEAIKVED